jgi:putative addiction module component (TIGR02574 family)
MTSEFETIFNAAQALPPGERTLLVERLLETLPADGAEFIEQELSEDEMLAELERRRQEVIAGTVEGIPWSELKKNQ